MNIHYILYNLYLYYQIVLILQLIKLERKIVFGPTFYKSQCQT